MQIDGFRNFACFCFLLILIFFSSSTFSSCIANFVLWPITPNQPSFTTSFWFQVDISFRLGGDRITISHIPFDSVTAMGWKLVLGGYRDKYSVCKKVIFWSSGISKTMRKRFLVPKNPWGPIFRPIGALLGDFDKQHLLRTTLPNWGVSTKNSKCYNSKVVWGIPVKFCTIIGPI